MSDAAPAGWYDDGQHPGEERYWDGAVWTEQYRPAGAEPEASIVVEPVEPETPAFVAPVAPAYPPTTAPAYVPVASTVPPKRGVSIWAWLIPLIVVVLAGIGVAVWLIVSTVLGAVSGPTKAVADFNAAWNRNDCDGVLATVTQAYDESNSGGTCDIVASDHEEGIVYTSSAQSVEIVNDSATVVTREHWALSDGTEFDELVEYQLVQQDGVWRIDSSTIQDGEATPIG